MNNKTVGICLLVSLGLALLGGVFGATDGFYQIVGVAFAVFGVWAAVKLFHLPDPQK